MLFMRMHEILSTCLYFYRTKGKYGEGEKAEKFKYTLALVFVQCIINALAAKIGMLYICFIMWLMLW